MRSVAFLHVYAENDPEVLPRIVAFRQGLEALGWVENRNIRVEHRYSGGDLTRIQTYATELVRLAPDLIAGSGTAITAALKQATDSIPIVFSVVNDPVGQGFVMTLSRPGGNITGFTFVDFPMVGKWLEMLNEIAPGVRRVTFLFDPDASPYYPVFLREFGAGIARGRTFGISGAQRGGNRGSYHGVRARAQGRPNRRAGCVHQYAPPFDHGIGEATSAPCHLRFSAVRHGRRA